MFDTYAPPPSTDITVSQVAIYIAFKLAAIYHRSIVNSDAGIIIRRPVLAAYI